jgi:hypothetical protein
MINEKIEEVKDFFAFLSCVCADEIGDKRK